MRISKNHLLFLILWYSRCSVQVVCLFGACELNKKHDSAINSSQNMRDWVKLTQFIFLFFFCFSPLFYFIFTHESQMHSHSKEDKIFFGRVGVTIINNNFIDAADFIFCWFCSTFKLQKWVTKKEIRFVYKATRNRKLTSF